MRVLFTGSEGVLGRFIVPFLRGRGYDVRTVDVRSGADYVVSVTNYAAMHSIIDSFRPDVVIHFAALTSPVESWFREIEYYENNVSGTAVIAKNLSRGQLLIFASSCAVYGNLFDLTGIPVKEESWHNAVPLSPYGQSKLHAELVIRMHAMHRKFESVVLRFGNVYSPFDNKYVFWKMFSADEFRLNDPDAIRDYVSVADLAELLDIIIKQFADGKPVSGTYNVGHEPLRLEDVVNAFKSVSGRPKRIVPGSLQPSEFRQMILDTSKVMSAFGWRPKMKLISDGIKWLADAFSKRES